MHSSDRILDGNDDDDDDWGDVDVLTATKRKHRRHMALCDPFYWVIKAQSASWN